MRVLIQRVSQASVAIEGQVVSAIGAGLLVFVGIEKADDKEDIEWLAGKIAHLRIFDDESGVMNRDVIESDGEVLAVSQFTLHASTRKGNRPSYIRSARAEISEPLYNRFCTRLGEVIGSEVRRGVFGADMAISLTNDGPVTIWIDSKNRE
jgi:D-tyrosyl-tRNA(Tyr) deacylase